MKRLLAFVLPVILLTAGCPAPTESHPTPEELIFIGIGGGAGGSTYTISYSASSYTFQVNAAITTVTPTVSVAPTSCTSSPSMPIGLSLSSTTCAISGTPTALQLPTTYTITASNSGLTATTTLRIQVGCNQLCRIFVGTAGTDGNLGGAAGADAKCNSDAAKPAGATSTYRALIVDSTRRACSTANCGGGISENLDWVLYPNKIYYRPDGTTIIMTTNAAGIAAFNLTNPMTIAAANPAWTGLNADWTSNSVNCSNWTTTAGTGAFGTINSATSSSIFQNTTNCTGTTYYLYCVER